MAVFEFGSFRLDSATRSLFRNGNPQTLAPKTFDVLLYLVERRARVVSKNGKLEALWPGTFVEEGNLSQQIFLLRRLLDGNTAPEYIATLPRRGYRFVGDGIERVAPDPPPPPKSSRTSHRSLWTALIVAGLGVSAAALAFSVGVSVGRTSPSRASFR